MTFTARPVHIAGDSRLRAVVRELRIGGRRSRRAVVSAVVVLLVVAGCSSSSRVHASAPPAVIGAAAHPSDRVPRPKVTGPIVGGTQGHPFDAAPIPLHDAGYSESEYFIRGTATAFVPTGTWGPDGRWSVHTGVTSPYETRLLVRRPVKRRFNGTVVVEWLNDTLTADTDPDFAYANQELLRDGYAWVGVSAQQIGVTGPLGLRAWDPVRYGALQHPGDSFSYSIYSQAAEALLHPVGADPLRDLHVRRLIADGESQSAGRMVTYSNAIQPRDRLFDAILIHSRGASGAPISQAPQPTVTMPPVAAVRADVGVPVLTFESETDILALGNGGYYPATQPDSRWFRLWEVAGTAHLDSDAANYIIAEAGRDLSQLPSFSCTAQANTGQEKYVMDAAVAQLDRWTRTGTPPPSAPRLTVIPGTPPTFATDANGNVLGGIRTPAVDAPIATLSGTGNSGVPGNPLSTFCVLFGSTQPFSAQKLLTLYPRPNIYVAAVDRSAAAAQQAGFLLPADVLQIDREAIIAGISSPTR